MINSYYESKDGRSDVETRTEEADKVSARIAKILSEKAFTFSPTQYLSIHRELFLGFYFQTLANPCVRGRQYQNDSCVFNKVSSHAWI